MAVRYEEDEKPEVSLTSMMDCIFLMLIFFLVSSQLKKIEREIPIELPESDVAREVKATPDLITVSVVGAAPDHTEEMLANVACSALTVAGRENVFYCALSEEDIRQARALDLTVLQYQAFQLLSAQDPSVTADIVRAMDKRELLALLSDFEMDSPCDRAARAK